MKSWQTYRVGEICHIIGGNPAPKGDDAFGNEGLPFVKMKDLGRHHLSANLVDIENRVSNAVAKRNRLRVIRKGSLLLPRSGSVALNHRAILGTDSYMVSHICALEVKDSAKVFNEFLYYLFTRIKLDRITKKTTGLDAITFQDLGKIRIQLPPFLDQIRIASILSKAEALIAQRKESLRLLDELLKSKFLEMFGDPARNPKNHRISTLGPFISHITSGGRGWAKYYSPSGKRFIRSLDVQMNSIGSEDIVYVTPPENKETERTRVQAGDVLLTITGSKIGRVCFLPTAFEEAYISQHVAIIRTQGLNPVFLSYYLSMPNCGQRTIAKQQYGQAKPGLNLTQISNFEILEPDLVLQNQFAQIVKKVEAIKAHYQTSLKELENLYGSLSQRAFKGSCDNFS